MFYVTKIYDIPILRNPLPTHFIDFIGTLVNRAITTVNGGALKIKHTILLTR